MKTFEECEEWLREHRVVNQFYRNFHNRGTDWHPEFHTIKSVYNNRGSNLINACFEWYRTPEESSGESFWHHIHKEFVDWF